MVAGSGLQLDCVWAALLRCSASVRLGLRGFRIQFDGCKNCLSCLIPTFFFKSAFCCELIIFRIFWCHDRRPYTMTASYIMFWTKILETVGLIKNKTHPGSAKSQVLNNWRCKSILRSNTYAESWSISKQPIMPTTILLFITHELTYSATVRYYVSLKRWMIEKKNLLKQIYAMMLWFKFKFFSSCWPT